MENRNLHILLNYKYCLYLFYSSFIIPRTFIKKNLSASLQLYCDVENFNNFNFNFNLNFNFNFNLNFNFNCCNAIIAIYK